LNRPISGLKTKSLHDLLRLGQWTGAAEGEGDNPEAIYNNRVHEEIVEGSTHGVSSLLKGGRQP